LSSSGELTVLIIQQLNYAPALKIEVPAIAAYSSGCGSIAKISGKCGDRSDFYVRPPSEAQARFDPQWSLSRAHPSQLV